MNQQSEMGIKSALEFIRRGGHINDDLGQPAYVLPDGRKVNYRGMCDWLAAQTDPPPSVESLRRRSLFSTLERRRD